MARKQRFKPAAVLVPLFIVEGCTETNYIKLLNKLFEPQKAPKTHNCRGGSAKNILFEAEKKIREDNYSSYVVIFDADTYQITDKTKKQKSIHKSCQEYEKELHNYIPKYDKNDCVLLEKFIKKENIAFAMKNHANQAKIFEQYYPIFD
jgi:hypothetical protein